MKRTKYDAVAPIIGKCDIDTQRIWNKRRSVSDDLTPRVLNILNKEYKNENGLDRVHKI